MHETQLKKLDFIDALRGFAILGVICIHVYEWTGYYGTGLWLISKGSRGVQLFYILSAFTLFYSMNTRKDEKKPLGNYFIRRFFRIAPLFYVAILFYLFHDGLGPRYWLGNATHISPENIISTFTFTNGFNPYWINSIVPGGWSIAIEMVFYLILPLLFNYLKSIKSSVIWLVISFLLMKVFIYFFTKHPLIDDPRLWKEFLFLYLPSQLPVFSCGILAYYLWKKMKVIPKVMSVLLFMVGLVIIALAFPLHGKYFPEHILFAISFSCFMLALSNWQVKLFVNPVTCYLGRISFSLYLVHQAIIDFLNSVSSNFPGTFWISYLLVLVASCIVASITYISIEQPGIALGKKIIEFREAKS